MSNMIHLGKGPCSGCAYVNDDVLLTGETWPAPDGGTYWAVADGQTCPQCEKPLTWFYERPIILELPERVRVIEYGQS
jgi:hypothetical protein